MPSGSGTSRCRDRPSTITCGPTFRGTISDWQLRFGLRYDDVSSKAAAAKTDRDESLFTGNAVLQFGLGYVSRAAGVTERYFAFALVFDF